MHGKPFSHKEFFVRQWAEYVNSHDNWSALQARLINAQIQSAKKIRLNKEEVSLMRDPPAAA